MLAWLFEQRNQPLDLAGRIFIRFLGICGLLQQSIHQHRDRLRDAIEDQQLIRQEKIHYWGLKLIVRWPWHDRLDVMNILIPNETDRSSGETRQSSDRHRAIFLHQPLHYLQTVANLSFTLRISSF